MRMLHAKHSRRFLRIDIRASAFHNPRKIAPAERTQ